MARAQFDREEVIDNAIKLFWQNGFKASSMQQVIKATGLKPGSIYLAFGNKEGLYMEALESYAAKSEQILEKLLTSAPTVGEGICAVFEYFLQDSEKENYSSCFLVKTQLELAGEGGETYGYANQQLMRIENLFKKHLLSEYDEASATTRAASIMLHLFGMRVYSYHDDSMNQMRTALHLGLPWLPWSP